LTPASPFAIAVDGNGDGNAGEGAEILTTILTTIRGGDY
jgi:hypothetical protein